MHRRIALLTLALLALSAEAAAQAPAGRSLLERADLARSKGAADAPLTIVEISDFQCPFCRDFATGTLPRLDSAYISTGKVRLIFFNLPIPSHPAAWAAAEAALCAGVQDAFWPMHDRLFERQDEWSRAESPAPHLERYARELGLDAEALMACTLEDRVAPILVADVMRASGAGATATPTLILGGREVLTGARTFEELSEVIDRLLAAPREP